MMPSPDSPAKAVAIFIARRHQSRMPWPSHRMYSREFHCHGLDRPKRLWRSVKVIHLFDILKRHPPRSGLPPGHFSSTQAAAAPASHILPKMPGHSSLFSHGLDACHFKFELTDYCCQGQSGLRCCQVITIPQFSYPHMAANIFVGHHSLFSEGFSRPFFITACAPVIIYIRRWSLVVVLDVLIRLRPDKGGLPAKGRQSCPESSQETTPNSFAVLILSHSSVLRKLDNSPSPRTYRSGHCSPGCSLVGNQKAVRDSMPTDRISELIFSQSSSGFLRNIITHACMTSSSIPGSTRLTSFP